MREVSESLRDHYARTFAAHGPSAKGVDWGEKDDDLRLRYDKMLSVIADPARGAHTILDVGCGYGGLLQYGRDKGLDLRYTGIDIVEPMIEWAKRNVPQGRFIAGDVFDWKGDETFEYVVCNGILTQKLGTPRLE